jgi:hypothetical protein
MSVRITTDVFCDGCGRWAGYRVSERALTREAQRAAKAQGWVFDRKRDCRCPACTGARPHYWGSSGSQEIPPLRSKR